jgi:hypothetical protein
MTHAERRAHWQSQIHAQSRSGVSARRWCLAHDVNLVHFYQWRRRLTSSAEPQCGSFVELLSAPKAGTTASLRLEWQGWSLHLNPDFDESTLRRVLRLLPQVTS